MKKSTKTEKQDHAEREYQRLLSLYREAGVDDIKLRIYDSLIRKVAEIYGILESIKDLPSLYYDPKNRANQRETAAGKARVKYMAQYSAAMQRLNKELLGAVAEDDADLEDYE